MLDSSLGCIQGPGLCHGVSGNTYALLSAYQKTQDARYLVRSTRFALWLAEHWQELCNHADRPLSLFEVGYHAKVSCVRTF